MNTRRQLLVAAAAAPFAGLSLAAGPALANPNAPRFVFMILRGGMDGLIAAPPVGDPSLMDARGALASFQGEPLKLDATFALNPLLPQLHTMYGRGELALVQATGIPYRERSHFDAQQVLESGGSKPHELSTGWLGRALNAAASSGTRTSSGARPGALQAVALETAVPLVLRGPTEVDTWAPSTLPEPSADLVARLETMYRSDPALAQALARARGLRDDGMAGAAPDMGGSNTGGRRAAVALASKAAEFLQRGSQVAVLEMGGWDSHVDAAAANGALSNNLRTLDASLAALREGLLPGGVWGRTVVVVATEFGREVAANGTGGADHGTGGAAFVLGGAVRGGRVLADWPGLAKKDRYEGRDLRITTDLRAVLRPVLMDHLRVPRSAVDSVVLPGSAAVKGLDLLKA